MATELRTLWVLLRMLRGPGTPGTAVLAYAWPPLVVFEGVQAGHVDLLLILFVLLAFMLRQGGSSIRAGGLLGIAALIKLYPALLAAGAWRKTLLRPTAAPLAVRPT